MFDLSVPALPVGREVAAIGESKRYRANPAEMHQMQVS